MTVAEVAIGGTLTPISFRRLEPLPTNAFHGLTPLMMVLRRMKTLLPSVQIGATVCALPDFKPFGRDGSNRRAYLVAAFQAPKHPLTILIDIDRGPTMSLSALQLTTSKTLSEIEPVIHEIMRSLVERNGSWPSDSELIYPRVRLDRHPRLMREASKQRSNDYQSLWAETLIYKLGLSRFGGFQSHRS